ncbi:F-box domain-containing protein [Favolaschia claudopus]|uniref:F-box domain-containing protein n=1 Tax=Favolaschia claudopus TaxID=2862362 RepID=A0AAW0DLH6_9AGAR
MAERGLFFRVPFESRRCARSSTLDCTSLEQSPDAPYIYGLAGYQEKDTAIFRRTFNLGAQGMLAHLETDRAFMAETEAQILNLEAQILVLRQAQKPVQERLDSYRYPVLSLPNEIVSGIFLCVIPPYPQPLPAFGIHSPTTLTHVCRQWRDIALATQRLWRALWVEGEAYDGSLRTEWRALAALWAERSGTHPMSIYVDSAADPTIAFPTQQDRLEYLRIRLRRSHRERTTVNSLPSLHSLELTAGTLYSTPASFTLQDDAAPLLRNVLLVHIPLKCVTLPWAQLTSLKLAGVAKLDRDEILRRTSSLVCCEIELSEPYEHLPPGLTTGEIRLLHLESLFIISRDWVHFDEQLLPNLLVPALRRFEVPETCLGLHPIESLQSLISDSMCQLTELRVTRATLPEASYRAHFPSIPLIEVDATRAR